MSSKFYSLITCLLIFPQCGLPQSKPDKQLVENKKEIAIRFIETLERQDSIRAMQFLSPDLSIEDKANYQKLVSKGSRELYKYKSFGFGIIPVFLQDQIRFTCFYEALDNSTLYKVYITFTNTNELYITQLDIRDQAQLMKIDQEWKNRQNSFDTVPPPTPYKIH